MSQPSGLPLSNHVLYEGHDVDDAREVLSRLFTEIALEPLDTSHPFRIQVNGVELPRISVCHIHFESGAVAGPLAPMDFHTLQLNPTGEVIYRTDAGSAAGDKEKGVVLSAGQTVRNHHSAGNGNLALIVKDEVLRDYVSLWTGNGKTLPLQFNLGFNPDNPRVASFLTFVDQFMKELNRPGGVLEAPAAIASFEQALLTSMLFGLENSYSNRLESVESTPDQRVVHEIEEYVAHHFAGPIDMATLCKLVNMSGASIHRAFRKYRGTTPMQFLQQARMQGAHKRLLSGYPSDTVTKIAIECGFSHMGRFAASYFRRYGEKPSQTLRRATNGYSSSTTADS